MLAGRNLVVPVPDGVSLEHACFTTLGSIALHAVSTANIGLGETVAVIGLGLVGQLVAQLARLQGGTVVGIDLKQERIELGECSGPSSPLHRRRRRRFGADQRPMRGLRDRGGRRKVRRAVSCGARICRDRGRS